jgi:hypothetical protein
MNSKPPVRPPSRTKLSVFGTPWPLDPPLLRIRLRYVTARFLQMPEPRMSLRNTGEILGWAQQMVDDGMPRAANELLRLAIEEDAEQRPLWLFLIERTFRDENVTDFGELVQAFKTQFPADPAFADLEWMEKTLARTVSQPRSDDGAISGAWRLPAFAVRDDAAQRAMHAALLQANPARQP